MREVTLTLIRKPAVSLIDPVSAPTIEPAEDPSKPSVSIAMTCYNGARYIAQQLDSFRKQTLLPIEIVITDDGEDDGTQPIIAAFAAKAPFPVHYVRNKVRLGFQDNFLKAASLCKGTYIAFADQDDVWLPQKLERSYHAMIAHDAALATHAAIVTDADLRPLGRLDHGVSGDEVHAPSSYQALPGSAYGFTLMFRRDLLETLPTDLRPHVPGEPGKVLYHDVWISLLASAFGVTVHIAEPLAYYRQHSGNALGAAAPSRWQRLMRHIIVPLQTYVNNEVYARQCADAFAQGAKALRGEARAQALTAATYHLQLADQLKKRLALYTARGLAAKISAFRQLKADNAYRPKSEGGLGKSALYKDIAFAFARTYHAPSGPHIDR